MRSGNASAVKVAVVLVAIVSLLGVSCLKTESFPDTPQITFKSFARFDDSASVTITFTDGDGDIGLDASDTFPPYDTLPWRYNLFLEYEELQNGTWVPYEDLALPLYYRVPRITPTGQNKTLEGEIAVTLQPFPTIPNPPYDTIRYSIKLADRALHESNVVYTDRIVVQ
ncbi:MAG: hypothetical protein H6597_00795 [Flavobacteriales bacterium]|nr:hypothetical protein [Flavobacteriales bacterium]